MGEPRERWHMSEQRVLVNFMYDMLKGRYDRELAPLRAWNNFSIQGPAVWSMFIRLQQDSEWDLGQCNHSAASCQTKWRKKVQYALHEVEGITPEKVLFIYFRNGTTLKKEVIRKITNRYAGYELTWRDGVLKDYQKKVNLHVETRRAEQESERKKREKEENERKRKEEEERERREGEKERKKRDKEENERKRKEEEERERREEENERSEEEMGQREKGEVRNRRERREELKKIKEERERLRREENERKMRKKEEIGKKRGKEQDNDRNGVKENERNKKEEERDRREMRKGAATFSPPSMRRKKIRTMAEEREDLETTEEEEEEEEAPPSILKKVKQEFHEDEEEEDEEEEGIHSMSGVGEYSNSDLRMMVNFMYDYMSGRCDKTFMDSQRDLEKKQLGGSIWKCMVRLQQEKGRDRAECVLSPALYTLIWSKCKMKLHEVEGVKPEKVLFIYKGMEIKLSNSAIQRISFECPDYKLIWRHGVLIDFKKKAREMNREELEEEEEEEEEGASTSSRMGSRRAFSMRVTPSSSPRRPRKGPVEDDSLERALRRSPRKKQPPSHPREKDTVVSKETIDGREKRKETTHVKAAASSSVSRSASTKTTTSAETVNQLWEEMGEVEGGTSRERRGQLGTSTSAPRKAKITVGGGESVAGVYDEVSTRSRAPTEFQPVKDTQKGSAREVSPNRRRETIEEPSEEENTGISNGKGPSEAPQQRTMAATRALLHGRPTPAAIVAQLDRPVQQGKAAERGGVSLAFRQKSRAGQNALKRAAENARQVEAEESSPPVLKQRKKGEEEATATAAASAAKSPVTSKDAEGQPMEGAASMKEMLEMEKEKRKKERMEKEKKDKEERERVERLLKKVKTASQWANLREKNASQAFLLSGEEEMSSGVWDELLEWKNVEERTRKRLSLVSAIGEMHNQEETSRQLCAKVTGWQMEKAVNRGLTDDSLWD